MTRKYGLHKYLPFGFAWLLSWLIVTIFTSKTQAQQSNIIPDNTLGAESSQVINNFQGLPREVITGGAIRQINLFHSLQEFNVSAGREAYFLSPSADIQNIFARVTGANPSEILGRLGTFGSSNPNLFLINPNGIIFGQNASLDVQGSFMGTTANGVQFGNQGNFSATNPEPAPLLTINPSALLFSQQQSSVISANQSRLSVAPGKNLALIGGDINLNGSTLEAFGGRLELAAVAGKGTVGINADSSLSLPDNLARANINIISNSFLDVADNNAGSITINAGNLDISRSTIQAGIYYGLGTVDSQAGDIILNATGTVRVRERSQIANVVDTDALGNAGDIRITAGSLFLSDNARLRTTTFGQGNGGDLQIEAADRVSFDSNARIFAEVRGTGNGGNIRINTSSFSATNGSGISNSIYGKGNAGDIVINASDRISLGQNVRVTNGIQETGDGIGGNIIFNTGSLFMTDNTGVNTIIFGKGKAGDIIFNARDLVSLDSDAQVNSFAVDSNGGNVRISTGTLFIKNDALLDVVTFGSGNAGNVQVEARDSIFIDHAGILNRASGTTGNAGNISLTAGNLISLNNRAGIVNQVIQGSEGAGGDIRINTGSLTLTNISGIQAITDGRGNAGNVIIKARDRILVRDGISDEERSIIHSLAALGSRANAGNIEITTGSLVVTNRALINTIVLGQGNAGNITINAENIWFDDTAAFTRLGKGVEGNSGNIEVKTGTLTLTNGAQLDTSTFGKGNSGDIIVNARDTVFLDGTVLDSTTPEGARSSTLFTEVYAGAEGNGGDIKLNTGSLIMTNAGQIDAKTRGIGNAGNIFINASDRIVLDGARPNEELVTRIISSVQSDGTGKGGNIEIKTGSLSVTGGAQLLTNTVGRGSAGNIIINARDYVSFDGTTSNGRFPSGAFSSVDTRTNFTGKGGNITIDTNLFRVIDGATVNARTLNSSDAGNITINAGLVEVLNGGQIISTSLGSGRAGKITVNATNRVVVDGTDAKFNERLDKFPTIFKNLSPASGFFVLSSGSGIAGDIEVTSPTIILDNKGKFIAESSSGNGGNINLQARDLLLLRSGSQISTSGGIDKKGGNGGNININAKFIVAIPKENSDISANAFLGSGGNVEINSQGIFGIEARPKPTEKSDITASSELGVSGVININAPDTSSITNGFAEIFPTIDTNALIAQSCIAQGDKRQENSFFITGSGALNPNRPGVMVSNYTTGEVRGVVATSRPWKKGDPIIEPTGVYRLSNGQILLSRECSN